MRTLTAWIIGIALSVATVAQADSSREQAKKHFAAGMEKFKAGDYRGAIDEFKKADAQVPSPILAYNIGLCHERLGENAQAILLYRSYLERRPDAPNKGEVEKKIAELQAKIDGEKAPPKEPDPPKTETEPPKTETEPPKTETEPPKTETEPPKTEPPKTETEPPKTEPPKTEPPIEDDEPRFSPQPPQTGTVEQPKPQPRPRVAQTKQPAQKRAARPAPPPDQPKKAKPIYKKWWFWVVVGVSAYILIDVATADNPNNQSSGLVLFRF